MDHSFGFIVLRHVNTAETNDYWNHCVSQLQKWYPTRPVVIIDDCSNPLLVSSSEEHPNVIATVESEYPRRGELLPFVYYLKHKWFPKAVIIHDSTFAQTSIPFERFKFSVLPLWHHPYDRNNLPNVLRLAKTLKGGESLQYKLTNQSPLGLAHHKFHLCFGIQCVIEFSFLERLQRKYNFLNLVSYVRCREDRCSLERLFGLLFCEECPPIRQIPSLFGNIMKVPRAFSYTYKEYQTDVLKNNVLPAPVIKVWTGR